jgi:hypothetical protein
MPRHGPNAARGRAAARRTRPPNPQTANTTPLALLTADLPLATRIRLNKLRPSTQRQYAAAFRHFEQFAESKDLPVPTNAEELDQQLVRFAEFVFARDGGRGRQTAACARFACMWLNPALKKRLPFSCDVTAPTAWNRAAGITPEKHAPMTWPLACEMSRRLTADGECGAGVAVLLGFDCCLRVSEAAALRLDDVVDAAAVDARLRGPAAGLLLRIRNPKTGDLDQSVPVLSAVASGLLREWLAERRERGAGGGSSLFGYTEQRLQALFCSAADALQGVRFTWHSLRHGGATYLFMSGWSTIEVMRHGRWRSAVGAWHYYQAGRASVGAHGVAPAIVAAGERVAAALAAVYP